ncbi:MAG: hypothetical protein WHV28_09660 [Bacteroidota bacterium]
MITLIKDNKYFVRKKEKELRPGYYRLRRCKFEIKADWTCPADIPEFCFSNFEIFDRFIAFYFSGEMFYSPSAIDLQKVHSNYEKTGRKVHLIYLSELPGGMIFLGRFYPTKRLAFERRLRKLASLYDYEPDPAIESLVKAKGYACKRATKLGENPVANKLINQVSSKWGDIRIRPMISKHFAVHNALNYLIGNENNPYVFFVCVLPGNEAQILDLENGKSIKVDNTKGDKPLIYVIERVKEINK